MSSEGGFSALVAPTFFTVLMALQAGIYEEVSSRAIPGAFFMKNNPTYKRIVIVALLTSVGFGASHLLNLMEGAGLMITLFQIAFAMALGVFYFAVYARTGNILIPMVMHGLHDLMGFTIPQSSTGVMLQTSVTFMEMVPELLFMITMIACAVYLLRKSKLADIQSTWANIWAE